MKQKSSLKDRLVGSRYFSFGITLSLFVLLYVVGMMNYRGFSQYYSTHKPYIGQL